MLFASFLLSAISVDHVDVMIEVRLDLFHLSLDHCSHFVIFLCKAVNCALLHLLHDCVEDLGLKPFFQVLIDSAKLWQSFHGRIDLPVSVLLERLIEIIICLLCCALNLAHACQGTVPDGLLVLQLARIVEEFLESAVIFDMLLEAGVSEHLFSKELVAEKDDLGLVLEALDCVSSRLILAPKRRLHLAFFEPKKLTRAEDS